jgi:hypothetical protein
MAIYIYNILQPMMVNMVDKHGNSPSNHRDSASIASICCHQTWEWKRQQWGLVSLHVKRRGYGGILVLQSLIN